MKRFGHVHRSFGTTSQILIAPYRKIMLKICHAHTLVFHPLTESYNHFAQHNKQHRSTVAMHADLLITNTACSVTWLVLCLLIHELEVLL